MDPLIDKSYVSLSTKSTLRKVLIKVLYARPGFSRYLVNSKSNNEGLWRGRGGDSILHSVFLAIDYFLIFQSLISSVVNASVGSIAALDHAEVEF